MDLPVVLTRLDPAGPDRTALVAFMTGNAFPFHVSTRPMRQDVEADIDRGAYRGADRDSYWVDHGRHGRIGYVRFEDLGDPTPMLDLRLGEAWRGKGLAADALRAATDHVFTNRPEAVRFEGQTREDNIPMRRTFLRCGWVKEAHHREAWPVEGGRPLAAVCYAVLRSDWATGRNTALVWDDLPT